MNHQEREKLIAIIEKEAKKIRATKGRDYSQATDDANRNFKIECEIMKILFPRDLKKLKPEHILIVHWLKGFISVCTLIETGLLKGEQLDDKSVDNICYLEILHTLIKENSPRTH